MENMKDILTASFDAIMNIKYRVIIDDIESEMNLSEINIYCSMNSSEIESIKIKTKE